MLDQFHCSRFPLPSDLRRCEQVHIDAICIVKVGAAQVVGDNLRKRYGAAWPPVWVVGLLSPRMIVRVIETVSVRRKIFHTQDGVIEDALEAIAVTRLASETQKIARQLEMSIRTTGCLEAAVSVRETFVEFPLMRLDKCFVRPPAARSEPLCLLDHVPSILGCSQILFFVEHQIGARCGAQGIAVAVRVQSWQNILALSQRIK